MVLAKADPRISALYDKGLVPEELQPFGQDLQDLLLETVDHVLNVTGESRLLENEETMALALENRRPWMAPLNVAQVRLKNWSHTHCFLPSDILCTLNNNGLGQQVAALERYRKGDEEVVDALIISMKGVAAGMQNTG